MLLEPVVPVLWRVAAHRRARVRQGHQLIAVTGSFGKTTTARAIRCALGLPVGDTAGPNASYSLALALLRQRFDRPFSVFEVGIGRSGQMSQMAGALQPDIAVVTSIGSEHAVTFKTIDNIRQEKFELPRALRQGGIAVLNGDDPNVEWMAGRLDCEVITYGFANTNIVRAEDATLDWPHGTRLHVRVGDWSGSATVRLIGAHMVSVILAAVATGKAAGVPPAEALGRLSHLTATPGRMQPVPWPPGAWFLRDEYKSTVETIYSALDSLDDIPAARRIAVLGDITEPPSPQRRQYHAVGERAARTLDLAILVGETGKGYRTGLLRGGLPAERIIDAGRDWRTAWQALESTVREGDVVLLKGRADQRLERIALVAAGRTVRCDLAFCNTPLGRCDGCGMLERGWEGRQPVF
jgi:UDP-N-acetylmuramoyl-tripeptide--D-alanyl-D-alanine ligase